MRVRKCFGLDPWVIASILSVAIMQTLAMGSQNELRQHAIVGFRVGELKTLEELTWTHD
jgi:hypothetical protein